jgi:hypothetical protein
MSWLKNKKKYSVGDNPPVCPCPETGSLFSPGCVISSDGSRNTCALFRDKWNTSNCDAEYATCVADPTQSLCYPKSIFCLIFNMAKGVGLTVVQYGTLPAVLIGTAVAAGYIKSAES